MIKGLSASGSSLKPRMTQLEILANNIANTNTTGFKKDNSFVHIMKNADLSQTQGEGPLRGLDSKEFTDFTEGSFNATNAPLDLAIQGRGFFVLETPQGIRYTRNGNFSLSTDGTIVNANGYPVMGTSGKLQIPQPEKTSETTISIDEAGNVSIGTTLIGKVRVADFESLSDVKKDGASLFVSSASEQPVKLDAQHSLVRQGYLEESNVDAVESMVQLVELSRNFESDQRMVQSQDASLEKAMDVGRLQ
jgi:flagellar basal-body rod protein FlgF